jgi:site-specific DNA recombinase
MNLAFGYIRRSSYKQQDNNSVEIQKAHIKEFADRNNLEVPEEFIFIEDVTSAFSKRAKQRKELMKLKNRMIETNTSRVIFYEESRMDRTGYTFVLDFYRPLKEIFPHLEVYTTNSNKPLDPEEIQTKITLLLFRQESEIKSERAVACLVADLESEVPIRPGAKIPYGYNQVNKKLIPNEKAEIVTFIYYLQSWGISLGKTAAILNEAAIPSPTGKNWGASTVESILKNPVYSGTLTWHIRKGNKLKPYEFKEFHEPLINNFLSHLNRTNIRLQKEYGRLETPFTFLNKVYCSNCHEKLLTQNGSTTRNGTKYHYQYYVCKRCNYKLGLTEAHKNLFPIVLKHVEQQTSSEDIRQYSMTYLESLNRIIEKNIIKTEKNIDKLNSKGCIAKEQDDNEYLFYLSSVQNQLLDELQNLLNGQQQLFELHEIVQYDLFFNRFKQILNSELGETEKRLIVLYFVDQVLISPDEPPKILFKESSLEVFHNNAVGQTTET